MTTPPTRPACWPRTEAEAEAEQQRLRPLVDRRGPGPSVADGGTVAGVDVAYDDRRDLVAAAAVVLDVATLRVVDQATAVSRIAFPYVPGLLAFRELPAVLDALAGLRTAPGLIVCDGYGIAHPRRLGLASHLGLLTGIPCFGVAKTPFTFTHQPPGHHRGDRTALLDGGEDVGRALRTRDGVKPVFVSTGHGVSLDHACAHTLNLTPRHRLPETTRQADSLCRRALAAAVRQGNDPSMFKERGRLC
ncbi:endonuclease V [Peterkaempfera griseoplana]|uniref:endonuclease V n=1 Tax=Peterkaempfera griseoplana TaxID=66896 RepID=UPI0006E164BA|nr:endonuclease V [Peterkaempfera griseoplana]